MKKLYFMIAALLAVIAVSAETSPIMPQGKLFSSRGDVISTLDELLEASQQPDQLFLLQNYGGAVGDSRGENAAFYYENPSETNGVHNIEYTNDQGPRQESVVKLIVAKDGDNYTVQIQTYSGNYIQAGTTNNQQISSSSAVSSLAITLRDASQKSFWIGNNSLYMNKEEKDSYWMAKWFSGTGDHGRTRIYKAVLADIPDTADYTALGEAIENAKAYPIGNGLNEYTASDEFTSALQTAESLYNSKGDAGHDSYANYQEQIDNAATALGNAINTLSLNMPEDMIYIRVKSANTQGYFSSPQIGSDAMITTTTTPGEAAIWFLKKHSESPQTTGYLLSYYSGEYANNSGKLSDNITSGFTSKYGTAIAGCSAYPGTYNIYNTNSGWYYYGSSSADGDITSPKNPNLSDKTYAWNLERVTELPLTLNQAKDGKFYSTLYLPVAVSISGVDAYIVTSTTDDNVTLTKVEGVIPADEPVVLIGTSENATAVLHYGDATEKNGNNLLTGVRTASGNVEGAYYLGQSDGKVGFYTVASSVTKKITNKAYLPANGSGAKGYTFSFDSATGINKVENNADVNADDPRYNLAGQRVSKSYKGVVIVGGKKVLQ